MPDIRYNSDELLVEVTQKLVERGLLTLDKLGEIQGRAALTLQGVDRLLIQEAIVNETDLLKAFSEASGIPFHNIGDFKIEQEAIDKVTAKVALRHRIVPLTFQNGILQLATSRVPNLTTVDGLRMVLDAGIDFVLCPESDVSMSLTHFYGLGAETIDLLIAEAEAMPQDQEDDDISVQTQETGMVRFINLIIAEAIRMDCTDIHIEPFESTLRLRYRIDGILQEIPLPKGVDKLRNSVSSAVKIMANMDIAEHRKPHDGRIKVRCGVNDYDLRVSVLPTGWGETCCLRILNRGTVKIDLDTLGLSPYQLPKIAKLTELPHGVILMTGPTGSGKTTTLYALLARLNQTGTKIITVEDPVEYQMGGISQVQVHSKIGLTFASVLRSILRHDPDVILIGEIRDSETADIAVRSSLTGHLVLSTLHTNDAPSAVTRMIDMGVEPYLISSCVEGIVAQRLVRRVCRNCKEAYEVPDAIRNEIAMTYPDRFGDAEYIHGHGCPACGFTGYRGRSAINEVMIMTDPLRALVVSREPANIIKDLAMKEGMVTLRQDGWLRVIEGRTSVEEVLRVAGRMEE
ncbi:MAG: type II/IV secretion system protein [Kiritimatiellae bacterium]|jgi:type II secretory ATPase GspE/PulE/Tfp pilus assembly ATPase PilB-like protein|nr:type II/IV secretion system protein [Kiritimatiellia bacterium]